MNPERLIRFIAVFPALVNGEPVLRFRRQFDPLAALVEPHITLVFPFESELANDELRAHVERAVAGVAPFPVRLQGITGSEGEYLFLNVKRGNDLLIDLHDRLYTGPLEPHQSLDHTYVPHLTVGRVLDRTLFQVALEEAKGLTQIFETQLTELAICTLQKDGTSPPEFTVDL